MWVCTLEPGSVLIPLQCPRTELLVLLHIVMPQTQSKDLLIVLGYNLEKLPLTPQIPTPGALALGSCTFASSSSSAGLESLSNHISFAFYDP